MYNSYFLFARLLNKYFEETITIAQKLSVLKLEGINFQQYLKTNYNLILQT